MESEEDTRESKSIEDAAEQFIESTESVLSEELVIAGATIPTTTQPETTIETTTANSIEEPSTIAADTTTIDTITTTVNDNDINMEPRITTVDTENVSNESSENAQVTTKLPITTQR